MPGVPDWFTRLFSDVEGFFDRLKLGYKWRFNRWNELQVYTYRGYGTPQSLHLKGRVLDDQGADTDPEELSFWRNITNTLRRIETDEIPDATVQVRFQDQVIDLQTNGDGFYNVAIKPHEPLATDRPWHEVEVELLKPEDPEGKRIQATGQVFVPTDEAEFGVISDLDDTVIRSGAQSTLKMTRTVLLNNATSRVPFPGVAAFYRTLAKGPDRKGHNPIFYVSSSPWNLYGLFEAFMEAHDLPLGPIFLKDFGFTDEKFLRAGHQEHKLSHIRMLMEMYPELPFVLVGDSGQHDPEIYREIAHTYPDRLSAIYIRDVTPAERDQQVQAIAEELAAIGVPMVLAEETETATRHAIEQGLVAPEALEAVREDRRSEEDIDESFIEKLLS